MKRLIPLIVGVVLLAAGAATGFGDENEVELDIGGSISLTFGDEDVAASPGPVFDTDNTGSIGDLSLWMRNRRVQAGITIGLAQSTDNVRHVKEPLVYDDDTPFPLKGAYLELRDLFDVFDLSFEIGGSEITTTDEMGAYLKVGSTVTSDRATGDKNLGVRLELIPDVLFEGFAADILLLNEPGNASLGIPYGWGIGSSLSYENDFLLLTLAAGSFDFNEVQDQFFSGIESNLWLENLAGLTLEAEYSLVGLDPIGMGAAGTVSLDFHGFSPEATLYWKNADFGNLSETLSVASVKEEFDARLNEEVMAVDAAVSYNFMELIGLNLVSISGGYGMMLTGEMNSGWNAGISLNLYDLIEQVLSLGFSVGQYSYTGALPEGHDGIYWSATVSYDYHGLDVQGKYETFSNGVMAYSVTGTVYF